MKNNDFDQEETKIVNASLVGAKEDIIHKSNLDHGHDLRESNPHGENRKQENI